MKPGCDPAVKHRMSVRDWLLVSAIAVLIHLLLFLLFRPLPHQVVERTSGTRYTLYLEESKLNALPEDPLELRYWLHYTDPEQLLKPDRSAGFSMFCGRTEVKIPEPKQFRHDLFLARSPFRFPAEKPDAERLPKDFANGAGTPVLPHRMTATKTAAIRQYPVWTDDTGKISCGLFLADADSVQLLKQEKSAGTTILRLTSSPDFPASIVLRQSCGNPKLDQLAIRQLTAHTANLRTGKPQTIGFSVVWERPSLERIRKAGKP